MRKFLLTLSLVALSTGIFAQSGDSGRQVTFRFVPGNDMFYIPYGDNGTELNRLYALIDEYHGQIQNGEIPVYVDSYSARDARLAFTRANRVKSELILHKGLAEEHFITKNHVAAYTANDGQSYRDVVVVTIHIPARETPEAEAKPEPRREEPAAVERQPKPVVEQQPEPRVIAPEPAPRGGSPYCLAVRTNLLYDATLTPTLGIEWRINKDFGIKLDGSYAFWDDEQGKVQKLWLISPEARYYMGAGRRFYLGIGGNYGEYNIYGGLTGQFFPDDTGYQGKLWNAGITTGYQLWLNRSFSLDFNLGLGYTHTGYDSFTISNSTRVFKEKKQTNNLWGLTQAGISLVWTIGGND